MRPDYQRVPGVESFESRIVLSANCAGDVCETSRVDALADDVKTLNVSEQAFIAADNSVDTARDAGVLNQKRVFQNEYVGRYDDRDAYKFNLQTGGSVTVDLYGLSADTDLYLLDNDGLPVASSVNPGTGSESMQADLQPGTYFVIVENYHADSSTTYNLDLTPRFNASPDLAGNTFDDALALGEITTQTLQDYVGPNDVADVFQFHVENSADVVIDLSGMEHNLRLSLYSSSETEIATSNEPGVTSERIERTLTTGTYYFTVAPHDSASSDYNISVTATTTPPVDPGGGGSGSGGGNTGGGSGGTTNPPTSITPLDDVAYFGGAQQWGLNAINAPEAWSAGYTGQGVTVAIIDTGIQLNHADLQSSIWVNTGEFPGDGIDNDGNGYVDDRFGWDFVDGDNTPNDGNGHGTHVAGIVAAAQNTIGSTGVAWASKIMPIRVLDDNGSGSTYDVARGIRYAADNGARVINLSLGGGLSSSIRSAINYAGTKNVIVVSAAGNEGAAEPGYPARDSSYLTNVISVGAHNISDQIASFSNRVGTSSAVQVDAPGVSIYNTLNDDRYGYLSGTSMATPYTAGLAALTLSANPALTSNQLRTALTLGAVNDISGSDSIGGINAAHTIPWALSGAITNANAFQPVSQPWVPVSPNVYTAIIHLDAASTTFAASNATFSSSDVETLPHDSARARNFLSAIAVDRIAQARFHDVALSSANSGSDNDSFLPYDVAEAAARSPVDLAFADETLPDVFDAATSELI